MSAKKKPVVWIAGEMGTSDGEHMFYVRSEGCSVIQVMTQGPDVCVCLTGEQAQQIAATPALIAACEEAAEQFDFYAAQHDAKGTEESAAKAQVNREKAASMRAALAKATGK